jgi:hypothetical protein
MVQFRGGIIGAIIGLAIWTVLFFVGHICQIILGGKSSVCPVFIIPFSWVANLLMFSVRINYLISLGVFLVICFITGMIIVRKR